MKEAGAFITPSGTFFRVWAPEQVTMQLELMQSGLDLLDMASADGGYFELEVPGIGSGTRYKYRPSGGEAYPDPASRSQPQGVHGPSEVVDTRYDWTDECWKGLPVSDWILYEIHVGTFSPEGTFDAIIPRLPELKRIGINALELMPVTAFPGRRNWGYDTVYPYAPHEDYGGVRGLQRLVDACHEQGIAVVLDVVYNHLGPEGNYFGQFGPYFNDCYKTPWGRAINYDAAWSDGVRDFFAGNALYWFNDFHVDGLRCDAIHAVYDSGAIHFWQYTSQAVRQLEKKLRKPLILTAESDLNSPRVVRPTTEGGYDFNAQWLDDFHHAAYVLLNPDDAERYYDFGSIGQLAKAFEDGFVHSGEWVAFRKRKHGASSAGIPGHQFVVFNQNHDQIGNRVRGERLCMLTDFNRIKMAAALILLSPYVPMLFMGEEYADDVPFYYFVSHSDPNLIDAVRRGRAEEFKDFGFDQQPPDAQDEQTFLDSRICWEKRTRHPNQIILRWHQQLIALRQGQPGLQSTEKHSLKAIVAAEKTLMLLRTDTTGGGQILILFHFGEEKSQVSLPFDLAADMKKVIDSTSKAWQLHAEKFDQDYPVTIQRHERIDVLPWSVVVYCADT